MLSTAVALPPSSRAWASRVGASLPPDSCVHAGLGERRVGPADASRFPTRESVTEPPDAATISRETLEATVIDGSDAVKHFNLERHSTEAALSAPPELTTSCYPVSVELAGQAAVSRGRHGPIAFASSAGLLDGLDVGKLLHPLAAPLCAHSGTCRASEALGKSWAGKRSLLEAELEGAEQARFTLHSPSQRIARLLTALL